MSKPTITAEEFASWQADPVTQWVVAACAKAGDECRDAWLAASWGETPLDPLLRCKLFTYADAMRALAETDYADWLKVHGEDAE